MARDRKTTTISFSFTFLHRKIYILLEDVWKNLAYSVAFALQCFLMAGHGKSSNKTSTPMQISIGFVDAILQPKILGCRLGILM